MASIQPSVYKFCVLWLNKSVLNLTEMSQFHLNPIVQNKVAHERKKKKVESLISKTEYPAV